MANAKSTRTIPALPEAPEGIEYRLLKDYPGYAVGSDGTVFGCRVPGPGGYYKSQWKRLSPRHHRDGHLYVNLYCSSHPMKSWFIHTLVLSAFAGDRAEGQVCRHLNGIATDNRLENLAWGSVSENCIDRVRHGRNPVLTAKGIAHPQGKLTDDQLEAVMTLARSGCYSHKYIGQLFGISSGYVGELLRYNGRNRPTRMRRRKHGKTCKPD